MPLDLSSGWLEHLDSDPTFLVSCWRVQLMSGDVIAITNNTEDLSIDDQDLPLDAETSNVVIYESTAGMAPSSDSVAAGAHIDNLNIQFLLDSGLLSEADMHSGRLIGAEVLFFTVCYKNLGLGPMDIRRSYLGALAASGQVADVEINALHTRMQQATGEVTGDICRHVFGDAGCTKDLGGERPDGFAYTVTGVEVTSVDSKRRFTVSDVATWPDDFFERGYVRFTSGANQDLAMDVEKFEGADSGHEGRVTLRLPMFLEVQVGDLLTMVGGCKKTWRACWQDHDNIINAALEYKHPTSESVQRIAASTL